MKLIEITQDFTEESFCLFDASNLKIGDVVINDIYIKRSEKFIIIIEAGSILTEKLFATLQRHKELFIVNLEPTDIHALVDNTKNVKCKTLLTRIKKDKNDFLKTLDLLYTTNHKIFTDFLNNQDNKIDLGCIDSVVESIIFLIQNNKNYLKIIMPKIYNDHKLYIHSLNVTIYALHLGSILHYDDQQLFQLGRSALLHDLGKKNIGSIIEKNSELTDKELELIYKRVEHCILILENNNITDTMIHDAIKHHQERYDGSGYPNNLRKDDICEFGSVLAICDVFDALTTDRPHRKGYGTFEALKIMMQDVSMKNKFNNQYLKKGLLSIT
ncbi:HD domain-containing protein [bacterium]|nr:HD domain-containing protein [bacterium]MBU1884430.1 HD domain-containing protein [bacterium]